MSAFLMDCLVRPAAARIDGGGKLPRRAAPGPMAASYLAQPRASSQSRVPSRRTSR